MLLRRLRCPICNALVGVPAAGGALVGTWLQQRVTGEALTYGFAALLVAVGSWLLVS